MLRWEIPSSLKNELSMEIAAHDANPVRPGQAEWRKEALDQLYLQAALANPAFMEGKKAFRKCPTGKEIGSYGPWEATLELRRQLWRHFVMARETQHISGQRLHAWQKTGTVVSSLC